ncbi:hypothetical protein T4A_12273 [Trichinella pseudospiralis]|uniref:Uncharacterized protein n=1 Tax=Trichinella pseudospiralis TaxID=6337 RepID=A0A0V1DN93_TRIPS|nr:hypothetical protein T4A_12273 [Trichinella pseudospiralis]
MTPSKSWTTLRRKRDQKSYLRLQYVTCEKDIYAVEL